MVLYGPLWFCMFRFGHVLPRVVLFCPLWSPVVLYGLLDFRLPYCSIKSCNVSNSRQYGKHRILVSFSTGLTQPYQVGIWCSKNKLSLINELFSLNLSRLVKFLFFVCWLNENLNFVDVETETHRNWEIYWMLRQQRPVETEKFLGYWDHNTSRLGNFWHRLIETEKIHPPTHLPTYRKLFAGF